MIEFTRSRLSKIATHFVGNSGLGEQNIISDKLYHFRDDNVKEIFFNFLVSGFKNDIYFNFRRIEDTMIFDVKDSVQAIFKDENNLLEESMNIANHLYRQSMHPKIKGGELYVTFIKDMIVDGELCDAVGIFKSESKQTYIKVDIHNDNFDIDTDLGLVTKKLDKGVLIFNTDKENGYKAAIIDNSNKISDAAFYWVNDFLGMEMKTTAYLHTSNKINQCIDFCEVVLTPENNVGIKDKMMILNNSVKFFDNNVEFNKEEFEKTVLGSKELVESYREHQTKYNSTYGIDNVDNFTISKTAVKKNAKLMVTKISLDENFDITIKKRHDLMELGHDEEKGMAFYKIYFVEENRK